MAEYIFDAKIRVIDNADSVVKTEKDALQQIYDMEVFYNSNSLSRIHILDVSENHDIDE